MGSILVIGAAHLDIVGEYSSAISHVVDKPGEIFYSVGGTAYNIAANLAQNNASVEFVSLLRQESLITPLIMSRLDSYGITKSVVIREAIGESGFIAQRQDGKLISAVTSSSMDHLVMSDIDMNNKVSSSEFVICDCNLSSAYLNRIAQLCFKFSKRFCLSAVSEAKVKRVKELDRDDGSEPPLYLLCMNQRELASLELNVGVNPSRADVIEFCASIGAEHVIVTDGKDGHRVFSRSGLFQQFAAPDVTQIVSHTGAGDALFSAVCLYYAHNRRLTWPDINKVIARMVGEVMHHRGATVGALTFPNELCVVPKSEFEKLKAQVAGERTGLLSVIARSTKGREKELIAAIVVAIAALLTFAFGDFDKMYRWVLSWRAR